MFKIWNCPADADGKADRTDLAPVIQLKRIDRPGPSDPLGKMDQADSVSDDPKQAWSKENQGVEALWIRAVR